MKIAVSKANTGFKVGKRKEKNVPQRQWNKFNA
jgi:hypothetical protein